ncbi:MAG TPA: hypothetical protein VG713_00460 [Pirellulales bacterium]|nr:hypothetical protein [Pirellulales bacterium]
MRSAPRNVFDIASDLDGPPDSGRPEAWVWGVGVVLPIAIYGVVCLVTQRAWFINPQLKGVPPFPPGLFRLWVGRPAMALGVVFIGVGAFAHFHWFWSNMPRLSRYYQVGKLLACIVLIGGIAWWLCETTL